MLDTSKSICRKLDALYATGKLDRVEDYLLAELVKNQPLHGEFNSAYITVLYEMGVYLRKVKQYARSRDWFKLLSRIICARLGPDSFENAVVLENIAAAYELSGEIGQALHCYLQTLHIYKSAIRPCHIRYDGLQKHVCRLFAAQGDSKASMLLHGRQSGEKQRGHAGFTEFSFQTRQENQKILPFRQKH